MLSVLGRGVTAFSPGRPTSSHPHYQHIDEAVPSLGPLAFTRFLRPYHDTSATRGGRHAAGGWRQSCPDTSRAGTGKGGGVSPGAYPLPTTHVPRHNQSEFLEKPIRETSHLRYVCEAHTRVPRHALQSERSDSISPQQPPTLLSVRFAYPHRACGTTHSTQAPTGERPLFVTDHRVQVLREKRMWTLGGPEKYVFSLSLAFAK